MKRILYLIFVSVLLLPSCGRKLDPMPPAKQDPVIIKSVNAEGSGIKIGVRINTDDADITLLGKAQGICPQCEDDLVKKVTIRASKGTVFIIDDKPEAQCMVYRVLLEKGNIKWTSPARVFCK